MPLESYHTGLFQLPGTGIVTNDKGGHGPVDWSLAGSLTIEAEEWKISWEDGNIDEYQYYPEAIIHARDLVSAQGYANLIYAGITLAKGTLPAAHDYFYAVPKKTPLPKYLPAEALDRPLLIDHATEACDIAIRVSGSDSFRHALQKYLLSLRLTPVPGPYALALPDPYISFGYGIILAYSAIEELGLAMQLGKRSRDENGKWIPNILSDLMQRLESNNIDTRELMDWATTKDSSEIESRRRKLAPDQRPWRVRKFSHVDEIEICDAIAHVSWLRNNVSSHRMTERTKNLTEYDVLNSQRLAGRLLLDAIGLPKAVTKTKYVYY